MSRRVDVEIGELVLTGFQRREGERVATALEAELARLCGEGLEPHGATLREALEPEPIAIGPRSELEEIGASAARAIHGSLER